MSKTNLEKMLAGELYDAGDPVLLAMRVAARELMQQYNQTTYDREIRGAILKKLLGQMGTNIDIQTPFFCDYGTNIRVGENFFANFNCVFLDCANITIGNNVFLAPNVQLYTAHHPILAAERIKGPELASAITIEDNVWLGGGTIICPGVTIGTNSTIGAGSVVTKDIPANVVAVGNPCRVFREL
ncbi:MAG: sugar O-acetyltransferase [Ferruginibacter sp.]|nr:sugar O-acetyltransferase [Ferruginibacter sp.]